MKKLILQFLLMSMAVIVHASQQTVTLPGGNSYSYVGCQVNGTGGNDINNTSFLQVPATFPSTQVRMLVWNCVGFNQYIYYNCADSPDAQAGWYNVNDNYVNLPWNPGQGVVMINSSAASTSFTLNGTTPTPVLPPVNNYCGCGAWSLLSCQTNSAASTYQDVLGFAPVSGSEVSFSYTNGPETNGPVAPYVYLNGSWTPSTPVLTNDQAAFFYVPCATNGCISILSSNVSITAPCGTACVIVPLTATAIDPCCSNVTLQYYMGTTTISATDTCFNVDSTNTVQVVATDSCGNMTTSYITVAVLPGTNCGCCGPGLGPQTIHWLEGSLSTGSSPDVVLSDTTCGSWLVTNLPCYGRVLITETFPGNVTDFNNADFQNVPNGSGTFVNTDPGYGPYDWGYCPGYNEVNTFTGGHNNLAWTLNFYFLDGPPNPCNLYLDAAGLAQYTTATVSQPVVFRSEWDLGLSAYTCISNAPYDPYTGLSGVTNAGSVGTVIGSYYNSDHLGDDFNTGWALFQPTDALPTTSLPQGAYASCPGYPGPATVPYLSLNVSHQPGDGIGFAIGYVCCGNSTTNCLNLECPGNIVLTTCGNCATANFSASATDLCCSNVQITYELNGAVIDTNYCFQVNTTNTVDVMATDDCSNSSSCSFTVTVLPSASCGTNGCITILSTNLMAYAPCGSSNCVTVPLTSTVIDNCCTNDVSLQYYEGGTAISTENTCFNVGTTPVTVMAIDGCGNAATNTFDVTVLPSAGCGTNGCITILSTNLVAYACGSNCVIVPLTATAIDNCCTNDVTLQYYEGGTSISAANTCFNVGTTPVTVVAIDGCGNIASNSFTVAVIQVSNPPVIISCPTNVTICTGTGTGAIIVDSDEWVLSDQGFGSEGDGALYTANCAAYLTGGRGTNILIYSSDFGLDGAGKGSDFTNALENAGYSVTMDTPQTPPLTLSYLSEFNAVFVGGDVLTTNELLALEEYVCDGGGVYIAAGTGEFPAGNGGPAAAEAAQWNAVLNPFGLTLADTYNGIINVLTVTGGTLTAGSSPVMSGVTSLDYVNGNDVSVIGGDPLAQVIAYSGSDGLIGVSACNGANNGCGVMPDETGLVIVSGGGTVTQSIPPGTIICNNTNITFTVSNLCGEIIQTNVPCELINCASNGCITILSSNLLAYALCGSSNCAIVPLTATVIDNCCTNGVTLQYYEGGTAISTENTCFAVGTNLVTVVATDGCGNAATNTFDVIVRRTTGIGVQTVNETVYTCGGCTTVPFQVTVVDPCCSNGVNVSYNYLTNYCFPVNTTNTVEVLATDPCGDTNTGSFTVTVLPSAGCGSNGCITILSTNLVATAPCGDSCVIVPLTATAIDTCCSNVTLQYYLGLGGTSISATDTCFNVDTTNTVTVVATDSCGNMASSYFTVTVPLETNCGCCGPGLGPQTIQWLQGALSTNLFATSVVLSDTTCGSWLVTNLPCYGRVLITETFPGNVTDFNNPDFQDVPNGNGTFANVDPGYGPYDWGYCPGFSTENTFTSGQNNLAWTLNFYFLDGPPKPCTLYLDASGLGQYTTATVSQPVVFRGEWDLSSSAYTCITNASYNPYTGLAGATNAGTVGTTIGSYYNSDQHGDDFNTGWALFQPTGALLTTNLPQGAYASCPGYPGPATVPYLSLNVSHMPGDGIGFTIGYVCCGNPTTNCLNVECPGNIVLTTCSSCAAANFSASATDLCCSNVQITYELNGTVIGTNYCFPVNTTNTVDVMATDSCSNSSSCSFTVTVLHGTNCAPCLQVACPTNMTVECGTLWTSTPPVIVSSCCPSNSILLLSSVTNGTCPKYITNYWQVSDSCGDTDTCRQEITVVDTTPPVITGGTNPVTGNINTNCELVIPYVSVTATDSCTPLCSLGQWQSPAANTIVPGPNAYVTVTVTDLCGNASQCRVYVEGVYTRGPIVTWPTQLVSSNCLVPCVDISDLTISDCGCSLDEIKVTQSPPCDSEIGPGSGQHSVTVTVTDCHGLSVSKKIPLTVNVYGSSFLNVLTNTGIGPNGNLLPDGAVDPHYTLGPVTGSPPGYIAPKAVVVNDVWSLSDSDISPTPISEWISPTPYQSGQPWYDQNLWKCQPGNYIYTNQFTLPATIDPTQVSIMGRWAADDGVAALYCNGHLTIMSIEPCASGCAYDNWHTFCVQGPFNPPGIANTLVFVVTNATYRSNGSPVGLRIEYLSADGCSTCAPPSIISMTRPTQMLQVGSTVTLNVQANGTPPLGYQWLFNGNVIPGATSASLQLQNIAVSAGGNYTVIVSDPCGTVTNTARLWVENILPWPNGSWNFAVATNPLSATFGPDISMNGLDSGTNFSLAIGTTEDLGLPNPGGQVVNVLGINPLWPAALMLPPIMPAGSTSNTDYSVIMDIYQPDTSQGTPSTLFTSASDGSGIALMLDASNYLDITGTADGEPFDIPSTTPMSADTWHRVALVVGGPVAGIGGTVSGYLDGVPLTTTEPAFPFNCPCCFLNINSGIYYTNSATILTGTNGAASSSGKVYVSGLQFHAVALSPQIIGALGAPDSGPLPDVSSVMPPASAPLLSASVANGTVRFTWPGSGYVLQETTDLASGDWADSTLPFTEASTGGGSEITTTAVATPTSGSPVKFYRLVFRP